MGFRFSKRIRLAPGFTLNLGKRSASLSVGVRGAHVTVGNRGTTTTVGVPGTGASYSDHLPAHHHGEPVPEQQQGGARAPAWRALFHAALIVGVLAYAGYRLLHH
jgi:hypothetical protein